MKLVSATIRPYLLDDVRRGLEELGRIISITEVKTFDPRPVAKHSYRGSQQSAEFVAKIRVEVIVLGAQVDRAIEIIRKTALTGHFGDGNIYVVSLEQSVRIRTGEVDLDKSQS